MSDRLHEQGKSVFNLPEPLLAELQYVTQPLHCEEPPYDSEEHIALLKAEHASQLTQQEIINSHGATMVSALENLPEKDTILQTLYNGNFEGYKETFA